MGTRAAQLVSTAFSSLLTLLKEWRVRGQQEAGHYAGRALVSSTHIMTRSLLPASTEVALITGRIMKMKIHFYQRSFFEPHPQNKTHHTSASTLLNKLWFTEQGSKSYPNIDFFRGGEVGRRIFCSVIWIG